MKINIICPFSAVESIKNCMPDGKNLAGIHFFLNGNEEFYDGVIVLQSTTRYHHKKVISRRGNTLLVVMEPQDILRMPSKYINQFDHVLTPNSKINGVNTIKSQFGQIWTVNKSYDSLTSMTPPNKTKLLSTVTSKKIITKGHKQRLKLVRTIRQELPNYFDWYGRGICEIDDKWDAIAPYKYHLIFENGCWDHYWSEKLTDAFMGFALPIYIGCPNISDYFDEKSMIVLNYKNSNQAIIQQLKELIARDAYSDAFDHILAARDMIINKYSIFNVFAGIVTKYFSNEACYKAISLYEFENIIYHYDIRKLLNKYWFILKSH